MKGMMKMEILRDLIKNDYIFYGLIFLGIALSINILSKFFENIFLLIKNFKVIIYYLKIFIIWIFKTVIKTIFFPITFYRWSKEYRRYNQFIVNNSRYRDDHY